MRNTFPAISHDGKHLAFSSDRDGTVEKTTGHKTFDLYLVDMTEDGQISNLRRITSNSGHNAHVQFSPDDKYLVFASEMGGLCDEELVTQTIVYNPQMYGEIYAFNIESGITTRLTQSKWENGLPSWAPPAKE